MTPPNESSDWRKTPKTPVHEVRYGLIKASIWENHANKAPRYSVTVCRLFKNGEVWKESTRFAVNDLLTLAKVVDNAHTWIHARG